MPASVARTFLRENLRNGITTSCVYCTVHPHSVDVLFEEAETLGLRLAAGKVLMDRNAPEALRDTPQSGYDQSKALIAKWHGRGRLLYAITPRYAGSSSPEQLAAAGALWREHGDCLMQTHIAETEAEVAWIKELFPDRRGYLDVYDHHGLCGAARRVRPRHLARGAGAAAPARLRCRPLALPDLELLPGQRRLRSRPRAQSASGRCGWAWAPTSAPARRSRSSPPWARPTRRPSSIASRCRPATPTISPRAARRGRCISTIASAASPPAWKPTWSCSTCARRRLIDFRMGFARDFAEQLFIQMTLGDDRAVQATYVAGRLAHDRAAKVTDPCP